MNVNLLNYDEFSDFIINRLQRTIGEDKKIVQTDKPMEYRIEIDDQRWTYMHLENAWGNYLRTGNLTQIANPFVDSIYEMLDVSKLKLDESVQTLIPVIRRQGTAEYQTKQALEHAEKIMQSHEVPKILFEPLTAGIEFMFAFDRPSSLYFAVESQLPDGVDVDKAKLTAKSNLIQRGWINHVHHEQFGGGNIYIYVNQANPFNAQFVIPELYREKLGDSFYVAFPNKDTVYVYKPNTYILSSPTLLKKGLQAFSMSVHDNHSKGKSPLSRYVYKVDGELIVKL